MTAPWAPAELPGLVVSFGLYDSETSRWVREPVAVFRCLCGFTRSATGASNVIQLTSVDVPSHRNRCSRHHTARRTA
jgi:predicted transcriptional regulator with HTH domain